MLSSAIAQRMARPLTCGQPFRESMDRQAFATARRFFTTKGVLGTGLGLSIVYQIVRDHKGVIRVRSTEGEGTVITIELPADMKPAQTDQNGDIHESENPNAPIKTFLNVGISDDKVSS